MAKARTGKASGGVDSAVKERRRERERSVFCFTLQMRDRSCNIQTRKTLVPFVFSLHHAS